MQQPLFPQGVEVPSAVLSALRDLAVPRARALIERVRKQAPKMVNLDVFDEALVLLERFLGSSSPAPARLAETVTGIGDEYLAGRISTEVARFVDETIARYWTRCGSAALFLDDGERVHRGVLDLVLGDAGEAHRSLRASLDGGHPNRADLWCYLGDASHELGRTAEANACYVRALILRAADVDLFRTKMQPLVQIHAELRRRIPESSARELLVVHAWLEGSLHIPPQNGWLDREDLQLARVDEDSIRWPADRHRRFARLLYLDRSLPRGQVDMAQREEMAALDRDLFARYMQKCREGKL